MQDYVSPKNKWGFVNRAGKTAIKAIYDDLQDFSEDLAAANYRGDWGFIDRHGKVIIDFKYKQVNAFNENRSVVQDWNNNYLLLDRKATIIDSLDYSYFTSFENGYAVVGSPISKGLIDKNANEAIQPMYADLAVLQQNLYKAFDGKVWGVVDATNEIILEFGFLSVESLSPSILSCETNDGIQLIHLPSRRTAQYFQKAFPYDNELALVFKDGAAILLDSNFQVFSELRPEVIEPIGEQMYRFRKGDYFGIIDKHNNIVAEASYEFMNRFCSGRLIASRDNYFFVLDTNGNELNDEAYRLAWDYKEGIARVISNRGIGFINRECQWVVDDRFYELRDFSEGLARFQSFD